MVPVVARQVQIAGLGEDDTWHPARASRYAPSVLGRITRRGR
jgi:hypothetical protein